MINFEVWQLCQVLRFLRAQEEALGRWVSDGIPPNQLTMAGPAPANVPKNILEANRDLIQWCEIVAKKLELQATLDRINALPGKLKWSMRFVDYVAELRVLRETIEASLPHRFFYHYPPHKAAKVQSMEEDWSLPIAQFPSAKPDILAAVDCWALGHSTAAIFHFMRVAEFGLRGLARERRLTLPKRPLEWATWESILSQLRVKIELIAKKPPGDARGSALEFYRGALGEFEAFKDAYRNDVMHTRKAYDDPQAESVMNHVREFMARLSSKIGEDTKRQILWGRM